MSRSMCVEIIPEGHEELEEDKVPSYLCCPVCLELFSEPRLLPCSHTVCQSCLKKIECSSRHVQEQWPAPSIRKRITCPVCRNVATRGSADMPCNRALLDVIEDWKLRATLKTLQWVKARIMNCDKHGQKADMWCSLCNYNICDRCVEGHEHNTDSMKRITDFDEFSTNRSKIIGTYISNIPKVTEFFENLRLLNRSQLQLVKDHREWQKHFGDLQNEVHSTIDDRFERLQLGVNSEFNKMFERISISRKGGFKCLHNLQKFLEEANQKLPDVKKLNLCNDVLLATIDSFSSTIASRLTKRTVEFNIMTDAAIGKASDLKAIVNSYKFHTGPHQHVLVGQRTRNGRNNRQRRNGSNAIESVPNNGQGNENANNNNNITDELLLAPSYSSTGTVLQQSPIHPPVHSTPIYNHNLPHGHTPMPVFWQLPRLRVSPVPVIPPHHMQIPVMPFPPPQPPVFYQHPSSPLAYNTHQPWMVHDVPSSTGFPRQFAAGPHAGQPSLNTAPSHLSPYPIQVNSPPRSAAEIHSPRVRRYVQANDDETITISVAQVPQGNNNASTPPQSPAHDEDDWMSDSDTDEYMELWQSLLSTN